MMRSLKRKSIIPARGKPIEEEEFTSEEALRLLREIREEIRRLNDKMDIILKGEKEQGRPRHHEYAQIIESENTPLDVASLLSLTDHLRTTAMVMLELQKATAEMVAEKTGRRRATESDCLNQLVRMGYLRKKREGLKVFFFTK